MPTPRRTNGQVLYADSAQSDGVRWASLAVADVSGAAPLASPTFTGTATFSGRQTVTQDALAIAAGAVAVDASLGNRFTLTATENFTLSNPTNSVAGQQITIRITQDGTGNRTITLGSNWKLGADITAVVLSTAANAIDYLGAICRDGTVWDIVSFVKGYA